MAARIMAVVAALVLMPVSIGAQAPTSRPVVPPSNAAVTGVAQPAPPATADDYVIGANDQLSIVLHSLSWDAAANAWRDKDLSSEVLVRPDGKITLPLFNDVLAAGLTPEQLRGRLAEDAKRYYEDPPAVTVIVKQAANNRAFITGQVAHPGAFEIGRDTTVLQLLAMAGGFGEFADRRNVLVMRIELGTPRTFTFNYEDVVKQRNLAQNIVLKPGDTVIVP
jgi:polysaccharide biosynthesis/export protein